MCAVATGLVLAAAPRALRRERWLLLMFAATAAAFVVVASLAQRVVSRVDRDWPNYEAALELGSADALREALLKAAAELRGAAARALDAPREPAVAFSTLSGLVGGIGERGVVLYRSGRLAAWAGQIRIATDSLSAPLGVTFTRFYLTLHATATRGDDRAVATALIHAEPPADSLTDPIDLEVARRTGVRGFEYRQPADSADGFILFASQQDTMFAARPSPLEQGEVRLRAVESAQARGAATLALALIFLLVGVWRRPATLSARVVGVGLALAALAIVPLNRFSNLSRAFDASVYFASLGGPFTASIGALALASALVLLAVFAVLRAHVLVRARWPALIVVLIIASLGPFLLRDLARGISPPPRGVPTAIWIGWEVALFLAATAILLAGVSAGRAALGARRGLAPAIAPSLAATAALIAQPIWNAPGRWPGWYPAIWILVIGTLALSRRTRGFVIYAAIVAAFGSATLVWGATARKRVELAERDVAGLNAPDSVTVTLLDRFARSLGRGPSPADRIELLKSYVLSDLAAADYPVELASWIRSDDGGSVPSATLALSEFDQRPAGVTDIVHQVRGNDAPVIREVLGEAGTHVLLAIPHLDDRVTSVTLAPRTRLIPDDPFTALIGLAPRAPAEPPYTMTIAADPVSPTDSTRRRWQRIGDELHGDWVFAAASGQRRAHVEVELRSFPALMQRGALLVLLDLVVVTVLWTLAAAADGGLRRWARSRVSRWARSYRARLTVALFAFFVVPAVVFAVWSYRRLQSDDRQARELLVRETLRAFSLADRFDDLPNESERLGSPLFVYSGGELRATSDPLYDALAPVGRFLRPRVALSVALADEVTTSLREEVGGVPTLFGFRSATGDFGERLVLAAPARSDELALDRQRRDLGILVLFATAVGAIAALLLSGMAAREFSRPIGSLRSAALTIAAGEREPRLSEAPPAEFQPVFSAFRRMAEDLAASRSELEEARRRTEAVLRNVASGVIAADGAGRVSLANPRAEALLGRPLTPDTDLEELGVEQLAERVRSFVAGSDEECEFDLELHGRQLHGRLTRLARVGGVAVLTLDDLTELARAQRVLAWGEMARQVAHEIKNPLTPIRLGVQHLKRARGDGRVDFDRVLDQNVGRILSEIDRLDEIARAFSRYGMAPTERVPGRPIDIAAIVRDVVELERIGEGDVSWTLTGADDPLVAVASGDELREVVLNVLENARLANATRVGVHLARSDARATIRVEDNGDGIPADVLPKIFEPHFSTRTSGSGLGLAISRSLVDGWGGEISVESERGEGTRVEIALAAVDQT